MDDPQWCVGQKIPSAHPVRSWFRARSRGWPDKTRRVFVESIDRLNLHALCHQPWRLVGSASSQARATLCIGRSRRSAGWETHPPPASWWRLAGRKAESHQPVLIHAVRLGSHQTTPTGAQHQDGMLHNLGEKATHRMKLKPGLSSSFHWINGRHQANRAAYSSHAD